MHQFHSGSAVGDAITNSMFLIQRELRGMGYRSDIYVQHRDPRLEGRVLLLDDAPTHADYALIVHHSMGHERLNQILGLPAPKILMYHNITPPQFMGDQPWYIPYLDLGRRELHDLRTAMVATLADSEYNTLELRRLGFESPTACPLLFDLDALRARCVDPRPSDTRPFTALFVGRVTGSKGQADIVDGFAEFARRWKRPCRLVLVGTWSETYTQEIRRRTKAAGLGDQVILTGPVSDEALHGWYRDADVFISLSHHEGFGVPLVEAIAHGVPVIAWPAGAVPYTLDGAGLLLESRAPEVVAAAILKIAEDPDLHAELAERSRQTLSRFDLRHNLPILQRALAAAGVAPPALVAARTAVETNLHLTLTGHFKGAYSLAAVNRSMALALEARHPGRQRIVPWENGPSQDLSGAADDELAALRALADRPEPVTEPQVVISQHYPLLDPPGPAERARFAMLAWEESLLSAQTATALNAQFRGLLTSSRFVAKASRDSGVSLPIFPAGYPLRLQGFQEIARRRVTGSAVRPFTFLHVSSGFPRKGVDLLIAAYAKAFHRDDPVKLIIKCFPNPHNSVADQIADQRKRNPTMAEIELIDADVDEAALWELYAAADAMALPSRGEGFNMPAAEALASELPLIVTGFGGHMDFCSADNARLVDFQFASADTHLSVPGSIWVEPDLEDLTAALKEVFADGRGPNTPSAERARRGSIAADTHFTAKKFADVTVDAVLDTLMAPTSGLRLAWVSSWNVRCGVAEYSRHLLDGFEGRSGRITVLHDDRPAEDAPQSEIQAASVWSLSDVSELPRWISAVDANVVVIQHQPGLISWSALADLLRDPRVRDRAVVVTLHAAGRLEDLEATARREVVSALRGASRVLLHKVEDLNYLKSLGLESNLTYFPQGALERWGAPVARTLQHTDAPIIGSYGFFLPGKGLAELIAAIAKLKTTWPEIRLRLANAEYPSPRSSEEIARCKRLALSLGLEQAIEWDTNFHPSDYTLATLSECDLIVFPYEDSKESSSAALRMGLASGAPVLTSPATIFDEAGSAVARSTRADADALAERIDTLLADQSARQSLQERASDWLAGRDWKVLARQLQGMLEGLALDVAQRPAI